MRILTFPRSLVSCLWNIPLLAMTKPAKATMMIFMIARNVVTKIKPAFMVSYLAHSGCIKEM